MDTSIFVNAPVVGLLAFMLWQERKSFNEVMRDIRDNVKRDTEEIKSDVKVILKEVSK